MKTKKHFEFVPNDENDEIDEIDVGTGRTLKRIRVLVEIKAFGVVPGSLGGYVEKFENLSGNVQVCGNAQVHGDADAISVGPIKIFWSLHNCSQR